MKKSGINGYLDWVKNPPGAVPLDEFLDGRIKTNVLLESIDRPHRLAEKRAKHQEKIDREMAIRRKLINRGASLEELDKQAIEIHRLQDNLPKEEPEWVSAISCRVGPYFDYVFLILLRTLGVAVLYILLIMGTFYLLFG